MTLRTGVTVPKPVPILDDDGGFEYIETEIAVREEMIPHRGSQASQDDVWCDGNHTGSTIEANHFVLADRAKLARPYRALARR